MGRDLSDRRLQTGKLQPGMVKLKTQKSRKEEDIQPEASELIYVKQEDTYIVDLLTASVPVPSFMGPWRKPERFRARRCCVVVPKASEPDGAGCNVLNMSVTGVKTRRERYWAYLGKRRSTC